MENDKRNRSSDDRSQPVVPEHHDVTIAALAAIALPGAGQFYNGQIGKGITLISLLLTGLVVLMRPHTSFVGPLVVVAGLVFWVVGIVDAALIAGRWIRREPIRHWQWF